MRTFGLGKLIAVPSGGLAPVEFAILQDVSFDCSFDQKELYGQKQFPLEIARAKGKIAIKASFAEIKADSFNQILNATSATGTKVVSYDNAYTITSLASGIVAVTVPAGGTWVGDIQVVDVTTTTIPPIPYVRVASSPTTGQYALTSSSYQFASADYNKNVQISYEYSLTTGNTITVSNQVMGAAPRFSCRLYNVYNGKQYGIYLPSVTSSKLSWAMKMEDFTIPDFEISAFADSSGTVFYNYFE